MGNAASGGLNMAVNFGLLQPAQPVSAFFQGQQDIRAEAEQNMLRQAKMQQQQRQQIEFEQAQADRRRKLEQEGQFQKLAGLISQHGMDPDDPKVLGEFAQAALLSGQPQLSTVVSSMAERAAKRRAATLEARQIGDILGPPRLPPGPPLQPGAPQNALARPAPMANALVAPQPDLLAGTPFSIGPVAAPMPAPAPATAAAAPSDNAAKIAELERQRDALEALGTERALREAKRLDRQLEKLQPKTQSATSIAEFNFARTPEGGGFKGSYSDFLASKQPKPPSVSLKVDAFVPASEKAQETYIAGVSEERKALRNAPDTLKNIDAAKKLIPTASTFMGKGGEPLMAAASFLNNRLGMSISTQGVTDATVLRTRLFEGILDNLKKLDSQPSQEQQRILAEALGNLGTDPTALGQILDRIGETVRDRVNRYNVDVDEAEKRGVKFPFKPQIKLPSSAAPAPAPIPTGPASAPATATPRPAAKQVLRTGKLNGRKVVEYADGSVEYAD